MAGFGVFEKKGETVTENILNKFRIFIVRDGEVDVLDDETDEFMGSVKLFRTTTFLGELIRKLVLKAHGTEESEGTDIHITVHTDGSVSYQPNSERG